MVQETGTDMPSLAFLDLPFLESQHVTHRAVFLLPLLQRFISNNGHLPQTGSLM